MSNKTVSYLAEYTADLRHVPGARNVVADMLSRPPAAPAECCTVSLTSSAPSLFSPAPSPPSPDPQSSTCTVDYADCRDGRCTEDMSNCPYVQKMQCSPSRQIQRLHLEGTNLLCDVSTGVPRPLVPTLWRAAVFSEVHALAHSGIHAT